MHKNFKFSPKHNTCLSIIYHNMSTLEIVCRMIAFNFMPVFDDVHDVQQQNVCWQSIAPHNKTILKQLLSSSIAVKIKDL